MTRMYRVTLHYVDHSNSEMTVPADDKAAAREKAIQLDGRGIPVHSSEVTEVIAAYAPTAKRVVKRVVKK